MTQLKRARLLTPVHKQCIVQEILFKDIYPKPSNSTFRDRHPNSARHIKLCSVSISVTRYLFLVSETVQAQNNNSQLDCLAVYRPFVLSVTIITIRAAEHGSSITSVAQAQMIRRQDRLLGGWQCNTTHPLLPWFLNYLRTTRDILSESGQHKVYSNEALLEQFRRP